MPQATRTFRIFVSSTFSDLKEERNALQKYVFPRLRDLAMAHGCRFQAIDLRWGVSEEAALDQQTMKICLTEIERCQKVSPRPNFVILLGDRFGWRPLPFVIPAEEFEKIRLHLSEDEKSLLCWRNDPPEGMKGWYRWDDNAVPAEYVLQPRYNGSRYKVYEIWESEVERPLVAALERAALQAGLEDEALEKYTLSATGQEIMCGAIKGKDAREHVFGFFRSISNPDEIQNSTVGRAFIEPDPENQRRQQELKMRLRERLPGNIYEYKAQWQKNSLSTTHIGSLPEALDDCLKLNHSENLCEAVWLQLSKVILAETGALEGVDALEHEQEAHHQFGEERTKFFEGREELLTQITNYLAGGEPQPLVVWGESGSGKSALMAKAIRQVQTKPGNQVTLIPRFIGATPESSNGRALLESLCRQITRAYNGDESRLKFEYNDLVQEFPKCLALATQEKPLVIFLDALDQLSDRDNARSLAWLPAALPPNVKLVISTLPGECLEVLKGRLPVSSLTAVPAMTKLNGVNLLQRWLEEAKRSVTVEQRTDILSKFEGCGGLPLYLKLAFEEARHWHAYDSLPMLSDKEPGLSTDIPGIIKDLFWRLEQESNHGKILFSHALGYLTAAKNGLSEDEMVDVLSLDQEAMEDFRDRSKKSPESDQMPVVIWSRLYLDLEPYLTFRKADGADLMTFYHRQVAEAARVQYLDRKYHAELAVYFERMPLDLEKDENVPNPRKTSEQVFQQRYGELWNHLFTTLTDFDFLEARCKASSVYDLQDDYQLALEGWQGYIGQKSILAAIEERLNLESHAINQAPELLFPQLYNHLTWLDAPDGPLHSLCEDTMQSRHNWLRITQDPRPVPPIWLRSMEGHIHDVLAVAVTPDGKQVISGSRDRTIKIWDLRSGGLLRSLEGHTSDVNAVAVTPDGKRIASGSFDNTVKVWDLQSGRLLRSLEGHTESVNAVAISPDGKKVVSGSKDRTINIWDLQSGRLLRSLKGHTLSIHAVAITPDGKQVVSGSGVDSTSGIPPTPGDIKVWDLESGRLLRSLPGHTESVRSLVVTPDGNKIVSGSWDRTIKVWDLHSGSMLLSLDDGSRFVRAVAVTPDGKQIISGSEENLIVWDLESGIRVRFMEGPTWCENAVVVTPDGKQVISGSDAHAVKVWDLQSGQLLRSFKGHTSNVYAVAVTPDGKQVVSGSEDRTIKIWDLQSGRLLKSLAWEEIVFSVAITPDGKQIISSGEAMAIKIWDIETGSLVRSKICHHWDINAVAITPDGKRIVSGSRDKTIIIRDLQSDELLHCLEGHTENITAVTVTPDGNRIVSGSRDKILKIWDLQSGSLLRSLEGHTEGVTAVAISPDGKQVISGSWDKTIKVWDLQSGKALHTLEGHRLSVYAVAITPDGKQVISGSEDRTIKVWSMQSGLLLRSLDGHKAEVNSVVVTPDGNHILSGSRDTTIKVWDLRQSSHQQRAMEGHTHAVRVNTLTITPDGTRVVSGSEDRTIKVWSLQSGNLLHPMEGQTCDVNAVAITPDGKQVVSGSWDTTIMVWDLQSGRFLRYLKSFSGLLRVETIAVTPDGKQVVSAGPDEKNIEVRDLQSGRLLRSLKGHTEGVNAVAVTPDGKRVISGSKDKTIKVWNLQSGRLLRSLKGHTEAVNAVAVTPDGRQVVSNAGDKTIRIWDLQKGDLLRTLNGHTTDVHAFAVTPDGKRAVFGLDDKTIRVLDLQNGKSKVLFASDSFIHSLALSSDGHWLTCGDGMGRVSIFEWIHGDSESPILTSWQAIVAQKYGEKNYWWQFWKKLSFNISDKKENLSYGFGCTHCRTWSEISESVLGTVLPCPNCGKQVELNSFTIEGDWRPIAKAWKGEGIQGE